MSDLVFYPETHQYFYKGKELPSVTTVLRFLSLDAYQYIDKYVLAAAADRGTRIHEACEDYDLYGELPDYEEDYDIYNYVVAYAAFCADYQPMWIAIEEPITDGEVAGTVDRIGKVKGITGPVVVDIKSSSRIYELSVSAQTYKYGEMYSKPCVPYCLHLKDNGTYEFRQLDITKGQETWDACYKLHKLLEESK
jgi:hypothetical protein